MPNVGSRLKRPDDPRLLTGRGRYVDDLALPRMVHAAFVRSVHAHARVVRVDLEAARRLPGVVATLTGADVAKLCKPYRGVLHHYAGMKTAPIVPLAIDRVRCVGSPWSRSRPPSARSPRMRWRWSASSTSRCPRCCRPRPRSRRARP